MQPVNQIIHTQWLMTCESKNNILENHALIIQDGRITDILPSKQASEKYTAKEVVHYSTHVVMPGFINSHTHIGMNLFRGLADDVSLMDWLNNHIWPAEKNWVSPEFVYDASLLAMAEMIRSGTTCFNDMYFFLQESAKAAELAGIRAHIGITVIGFPTAWAKTTEEYFTKGLEFYAEYKNHPLIKTTIAPHAIYTVPEDALIKINELALELDLKINMHIQETAAEVDQSLKETKLRPLRRLQNIGFLSPRVNAVHMTQVNAEDLEILAATKPSIVHCPESNIKLGSGNFPLQKYKEIDLNIALGTDGVASNNDLNMIGEMHSASQLAKICSGDPKTLPVHEVLAMGTVNGAKALGIDHLTGSLAKGKSADFIAINLAEIETIPLYHPASQIIYSASREQVTDVWVAGKQLMKNRKLLTLDEEQIKAKTREWQQKIKVNA